MDSLEQRGAIGYDMPRFDDGMVNIQELIRIMAKSLVNEIMDAQAEEANAHHEGRFHQPADTQAAPRQLLPRGSARLLLLDRPFRDCSGLQDANLWRVHEEGRARSGADGHRPHKCLAGIAHLRVTR